MRLAVSNLAWEATQEQEAATLLEKLAVREVEVAPTRVWAEPLASSARERAAYRKLWESRGIRITALQSLLFGKPELKLFGTPEEQACLEAQLKGMVDLAAELGADTLVFGSPKNRLKGRLPTDEAMERAAKLFARVGERAASHGCVLCIEPNAPRYGCDFVTTSDEGAELVRRTASPGVALHLDLACMELAGEDVAAALRRHAPALRHFHVSAPALGPVTPEALAPRREELARLAELRPELGFSIEMLPRDLAAVEQAVEAVRKALTRSTRTPQAGPSR